MSKLPRISGRDVVKVLCNQFLFRKINQRGSHVTLINDKKYPVRLLVVAEQKEMKTGTLQHVIADAGLNREDFLQAVNK